MNSFVDVDELDGASLESANEPEDEEESCHGKDGNNSEMSDDSLVSNDSFHLELDEDATMPLTAAETSFSDPLSVLHPSLNKEKAKTAASSGKEDDSSTVYMDTATTSAAVTCSREEGVVSKGGMITSNDGSDSHEGVLVAPGQGRPWGTPSSTPLSPFTDSNNAMNRTRSNGFRETVAVKPGTPSASAAVGGCAAKSSGRDGAGVSYGGVGALDVLGSGQGVGRVPPAAHVDFTQTE